MPSKVNVTVATVKTLNWTCPNCGRNNVDTTIRDNGLLFCRCTHAFEVGHVEDTKVYYYAPADKQNYMIVFEDNERPNEIYTEMKAAVASFEDAKLSWNCHLFGQLMSG